METKIRAGLYRDSYAQGTDCHITFIIQRDDRGEFSIANVGEWVIQTLIESEGHDDEMDIFERAYPTKSAAMTVIHDYMETGHFEYDERLGWCYYDNNASHLKISK